MDGRWTILSEDQTQTVTVSLRPPPRPQRTY
jgi:hypothetical protein